MQGKKSTSKQSHSVICLHAKRVFVKYSCFVVSDSIRTLHIISQSRARTPFVNSAFTDAQSPQAPAVPFCYLLSCHTVESSEGQNTNNEAPGHSPTTFERKTASSPHANHATGLHWRTALCAQRGESVLSSQPLVTLHGLPKRVWPAFTSAIAPR